MNIQWYPGHMTKARRQMAEDISLIDLVIELVDARIPYSSRNPDIDTLAKGKSRLLLLNKADLADPACNDRWQAFYEKQGIFTAQINSQRGDGLKKIMPLIDRACAEKRERDRKRGILNRPVRAMICGIPNVGKSTFINSMAGKAAAKTGNKPGVTRGKQWIHLAKGVDLLDTPGLLWPKFEDPQVGTKLALAGSVKDEITDAEELAAALIGYVQTLYPQAIEARFGSDVNAAASVGEKVLEEGSAEAVLMQIAQIRGCTGRDHEPDTVRAAAMLIDDFRKGRLGRISLEEPGDD